MDKEVEQNRRLLIYLYIKFNGDTIKMLDEIDENNLKISTKVLNEFFDEHPDELDKYYTRVDPDWPKELDNTDALVMKKLIN